MKSQPIELTKFSPSFIPYMVERVTDRSNKGKAVIVLNNGLKITPHVPGCLLEPNDNVELYYNSEKTLFRLFSSVATTCLNCGQLNDCKACAGLDAAPIKPWDNFAYKVTIEI